MIINEVNTYEFPQGSVDTNKVAFGGTNNNWGGSMERALEVASYARACSGNKNIITSQKRSRKMTNSGNMSDHFEGNKNAYGVDLGTGKPTKENLEKGDELLKCIMSKFENGMYSGYKGGKWLNVNIDGYRYQFGWRVKDHYDHIHVGVKKTGAKDDSPEGVKTKEGDELDMTQFNERSKENLNKLIDELRDRGVKNPEQEIKEWLNSEVSTQIDIKPLSFSDILKGSNFQNLLKKLETFESDDLTEEINRIKKFMK